MLWPSFIHCVRLPFSKSFSLEDITMPRFGVFAITYFYFPTLLLWTSLIGTASYFTTSGRELYVEILSSICSHECILSSSLGPRLLCWLMLLHSRDTSGFKHLSYVLITKHINHTKESIQMWKHNEKTLRLTFNAHFKTWIMFIQSTALCNMRSDSNHCLCSVFTALKNDAMNTVPKWLTNIFHLLRKIVFF